MPALKYVVVIIVICSFQSLMAQELFVDSGQRLGQADSWAVSLVDLDNDGDLDAYLDDRIWLNDGHGHFSDSGLALGFAKSMACELGDLDSDGDLDAIVANLDLGKGAANTVYFNTTTVAPK
jgi:hypothetical protein